MHPQPHDPVTVTVDIALTRTDVGKFDRWFRTASEFAYYRRYRRAWTGVFGAGALALWLASTTAYYIFAATIVALAILYRQMCKRSSTDRARGFDCRLVVHSAGLTSYRPGVTAHTDWSAVREFVMTDEHFFLLCGTLAGFIIPKHNLRDPQDAQRLIDLRVASRAVGAPASAHPTPPADVSPLS
jgi:hypothetical protein